ncbi:MAG: hypothetical protein H0U76_12315 [Ktedonobacteraceae bacterium]|nr:hypothetical protein [Ktedonobacteraceae bacterium]MBA3822476.1 hypothetical protein [Ktedonobacterales bacterium]
MSDDDKKQSLEPAIDVLQYVEAPDELVKYYLSLSRAGGVVYALAVKRLINRMYRDHDYSLRRKIEGKQSGYDQALLEDQKALAWMIHAAALYIPEDIRRMPIPPRPPKPKRTTPNANKAKRDKQAKPHD